MYQLQEPLTKEYILANLSQEQIMEYYLGVPITFGRKICSPLRKDNTPTCGFKYAPSGDLYFRDFSGHFAGNAFNIVQYIYQCTFNEALEIIAKDFGLRDGDTKVKRVEYNYEKIKEEQQGPAEIQVRIRKWNMQDKEYWSSFGISKDTLQKYNVFPVDVVWLNGKIVYSDSATDPAYAYRFDANVYKIYYPMRRKMRFISNTNVVQGLKQLPSTGKFVVLTKSLKDVMCLDEFGIPAVALQSESAYPEEQFIKDLKDRFGKVFTFYDFDYAGIKMAAEIHRRYDIDAIFLTNGKFNTVDYQAKDWTDFVKAHGRYYATLIAEAFKKSIK